MGKNHLHCFASANVAFQNPTWASSENGVNATVATVDGEALTCFSTTSEDNPWWTVDLGAEHLVSAVKLQATIDLAGINGDVVL